MTPETCYPVQEDVKTELAEELSKIKVAESEDFTKPVKLEKDEQVPNFGQYGVQNKTFPMQALTKCDGLRCSQRKDHCSVSIYIMHVWACQICLDLVSTIYLGVV